MQRHIVGGKCPHQPQSGRLGDFRIIGRIPRHRDRRRPLISLGKDSAIIIDGGVVGASHRSEPLLPENGRRGIHQSHCHGGIVDEIKETEEADGVPVVNVVGAVDDRRDTPYRLPVPEGHEGMDLAVLVDEDRLRPDQLDNATGKRRREARIRSVKQFRNLLESLQLRRSPAD